MNIIYVSPSGNDVTGTGTYTNPFKSIIKALTIFISGDQIRLAPGTYNESDSIIFNGYNGSIFAENAGALIQPAQVLTNTSVITIQNSTNFYLNGLTIKQAINTTSSGIGVAVLDSSNVYIHNCEIRDFITSEDYSYGIYGNTLTRQGRIEQCTVKNFACDGIQVAGIIGNFDIVLCTVKNISGAGNCESYGIYCGNTSTGTPTDIAMVFGIRQTAPNEYVRSHEIWSSWTEYNNNEMGAPIGDAPIYDNYMSICMWAWEPAQSCWGHNKTNNTDCDVYIAAVKVNADSSMNIDMPYLMKYNYSTNTFSQLALPDPGVRYFRMLQGGLSGTVINNQPNMVFVCDVQDNPEIGIGSWSVVTYIYNGSTWSVYNEAEGADYRLISKTLMVNNGGTPVIYGTNINPNPASIRKFNQSTHVWDVEYINPDGYDDFIYDIHGNTYNNICAIGYKSGEGTEAAIFNYDGNVWSYIPCAPIFGARFMPTSICITNTESRHIVGSSGFQNPGQYWYYNGASWEDRTSDLPIPSDMATIPILSGVRAKSDSFIVITAWDWDTYGEYLYTLKDGSWTVTKTSFDPINSYADMFSIGCGDNIFVGNINT